jgi:glycine/D-amino acid oxidase-like deaminating enzyme
MMGISLAPITGKLIAQIIDGERPEIDIRLLDPDRFSRRKEPVNDVQTA